MPESLASYGLGLAAIAALSLATWLLGTLRRDVSLVDRVWSLFFLVAALVFVATTTGDANRRLLVSTLVALWSLRLSAYLAWRNWGQGEDRRYRSIRRANEPHFGWKSLYLVFGLQAALAGIIALPLWAALSSERPLGPLDAVAFALWCLGMLFEAGGDHQLARFLADPARRDRVMDRGLWRHTRHPNYFGNACIHWSFYLFALSTGAWWSFVAPLLMTFLLLRVSGVALLERDIGERRPGYRDYVESTPAFVPWKLFVPHRRRAPGAQPGAQKP